MCDALGVSPQDAISLLSKASSGPSGRVLSLRDYLPLVEQATSPAAAKTYAVYWERLPELLKPGRADDPLDTITKSELERALLQLPKHLVKRSNERGGYQAQRTALQAWRKIFSVAEGERLITSNPAQNVKMPPRRPNNRRGLSNEEVDLLYDVVAGGGNDPEIDTLIFTLLLQTGARRAGVLALNIEDLNRERQTVLLREKGDKDREQPITHGLMTALIEHHYQRYPNSKGRSETLLRFKGGTPITKKRFETLFNRVQAAEPSPFPDAKFVTAHWMRHTSIRFLERSGASEAVVSAFAGHAPTRSRVTGIYTSATSTEVVTAWSKLWKEAHPLLAED